jgi:D-ribose pyranase
LHAELLEIVARLGHGQTLAIADAGLPIPDGVHRIDLAVRPGLPSVLDVLAAIVEAGVFETATIAVELRTSDPDLARSIAELIPGGTVGAVTHEELKRLSREAVAVVRTGSFQPYSNVILRAGVPF